MLVHVRSSFEKKKKISSVSANQCIKYENVQERGLYLKISKKTLGHYMFYWGIMGGGLLDSVVLIIKIQDVAVQIMSSIG